MLLNVNYITWWGASGGTGYGASAWESATVSEGGGGRCFFYIDKTVQATNGNYISCLADPENTGKFALQFAVNGDTQSIVNVETPPAAPAILVPAVGPTITLGPEVSFTIGAPVCFAAGTPVLTDQGVVAIDLIDAAANTIDGKKIVSVTKGVTDKTVVLIKKDCLGPGKPSLDTVITSMHQVLFNGRMIQAQHLPGVKIVPWDGKPVYNVELETLDVMSVNNLIVETAYPKTAVGMRQKNFETKCMRFSCNYLQHADIKNNGGTHCCLQCKAGSGTHGVFCMKLHI